MFREFCKICTPPNQMLFIPDPEREELSQEDEVPLFHVAPHMSFRHSMEATPPREEWEESDIFWWRWFVKHGLVTVDSRMAEDPARWHLEGLEPKYKDTKEVEMLAALEGLELGGD